MTKRFFQNYLARHRHGGNQLLHVVGVPLSFVASPACFAYEHWGWALSCFIGGYVLQFVGHAWEGNDPGEVILVKRLLHLPYVEFGPASKLSKFDGSSADTSSKVSAD